MSFGSGKCATCGAKVSSEVKAALHARLAASSEDYRVLQDQVSSARTALLVASLVYLAFGVIAFVGAAAHESTMQNDLGIQAGFLDNAVFSVLFLLLWWLAQSRPTLALVSAVVLWLAYQLSVAVVFPLGVFTGLWGKSLVAILMIRGIVAAVRAHAFRRRLRHA